MSDKTLSLDNIEVLTGLEAVRKRPSLYFDLADPLLGSKIALTPLEWAFAMEAEAHVYVISSERMTLAWDKPLPTGLRVRGEDRHAEAIVTGLHAGGRYIDYYLKEFGVRGHMAGLKSEPLFDNLCPQLACINAACKMFDLIINDEHGEWGQRFEYGQAVSDFELVGDAKGHHTFMEVWLDTELLMGATIDERFIQSWCGDHKVKVM